eukprot:9281621-Pyramimonas_sp.AAC.1
MASKRDIDWDQIANGIAEDRPRLASAAHYLCKCVQNRPGGDSGYLLSDLNEFWSSLRLRRELPGITWKLICDLNFLEGSEYVNALMKAIATAPEPFC